MKIEDVGRIAKLVGTDYEGRITAYMKDMDGVEQWLVRYLDGNGVLRSEWFRYEELEL